MIKITGTGDIASGRRVQKKPSSAGSFTPSTPSAGANNSSSVTPTTPTSMMSALLELQSDDANKKKTFAAAQHILDMLDQLKLSVLEGGVTANDLAALKGAAAIRAHASADPQLLQVYDEIALRARVELAKLGS